jgi:hypothetical protein
MSQKVRSKAISGLWTSIEENNRLRPPRSIPHYPLPIHPQESEGVIMVQERLLARRSEEYCCVAAREFEDRMFEVIKHRRRQNKHSWSDIAYYNIGLNPVDGKYYCYDWDVNDPRY